MKIIEKLEKWHYSLEGFTPAQRDFILGAVKMAYHEGYSDGNADLASKVKAVIDGDIEDGL